MTNDVFEQPTPNPASPEGGANPTPQTEDVFADQLARVVNEDGTPKYDSVPKAIDALANSQTHIKTVESENAALVAEVAALREQAAKAEAVEDVVQRLTSQNQTPEAQETPQPNAVDEATVTTLVQDALNKDREQATAVSNVTTVNNALLGKYGEKAPEIVAARAKDLGMTVEELKAQSAKNPNVVLALFDARGPSRDTPTSTSINLPHQAPEQKPVERPQKSLLAGASSKDQADFMRQIREEVYRKHNVET